MPDEWRKLVSIYNQGNSEIAHIILILSWLVIKWSLLENDRTKFKFKKDQQRKSYTFLGGW